AQQLPPSLAADGLGDDADRVLRLDEAEGHVREGTRTSGRQIAPHGVLDVVVPHAPLFGADARPHSARLLA
ncbi:MAG TPA: hypothetical protein VKA57_04610, partial [Solirubrobacteraceae bacterium]|nr:hypothetical protein [Solirubrobacteraceae bacterium]